MPENAPDRGSEVGCGGGDVLVQRIDWKRFDWARLLRIQLCLIAGLVLLAALGFVMAAISQALLTFAMAGILTIVLAPVIDWGTRRGLPRSLVVVIVLVAVLVLAIGSALLLAVRLASQMNQIIAGIPAYVAVLNGHLQALEQNLVGTPFEPAVAGLKAELTNLLSGAATASLGGSLVALQTVGGGLGNAAIVITVAAMMMFAAPALQSQALAALPRGSHSTYTFVEASVKRIVGGYVRGQLFIALLLGVAVAAGMFVLGVPYALLLGFFAALLSLVPMFGPILAAVPSLLVAASRPFPTVLWALIFLLVALNVIEQVIQPRVAGKVLGLHPLAVMFALLAGLQLAGFLGALFALPVAGLVWCGVEAIRVGVTGTDQQSTEGELPGPGAAPEIIRPG